MAERVTQAVARKREQRAEVPSAPAALAIRNDQDFWDAKQLAALSQLGIQGVDNATLAIFFHYSQRTGLDPFSKQIYLINRGGRWVIQVGIDGFRIIARRAADRSGCTLGYEDTLFFGKDSEPRKVWVDDEPPVACQVTVLRDGHRFPGLTRYADYVPLDKGGKPTGLWGKMPSEQSEKCSEARALRRAFPHDLGGVYIPEEIEEVPEELRIRPRRASAEVVHDEQPDDVAEPVTAGTVENMQEGDEG